MDTTSSGAAHGPSFPLLCLDPSGFQLTATGYRFDGTLHTECHAYRVRQLSTQVFVVESDHALPMPVLVVTDGSLPAATVISDLSLPVEMRLADVMTVHADVITPSAALAVAWPLLNEWFGRVWHLYPTMHDMLQARTHRTASFLRQSAERWARADVTVSEVQTRGEMYIESGVAGARPYRITLFKASASLIVDGERLLSGTVQADGTLALSMDVARAS